MAAVVDQVDDRDWRAADGGRDLHDFVEVSFSWSIEDAIPPEGSKTRFFSPMQISLHDFSDIYVASMVAFTDTDVYCFGISEPHTRRGGTIRAGRA